MGDASDSSGCWDVAAADAFELAPSPMGMVEAYSTAGSKLVGALYTPEGGSSGAPGDRTPAPSSKDRVLVVDDDADGADTLAMLMEIMGHEVTTAYDGEAALARAEAFRPTVVLLDIGMPRMNGYDVCRRLRSEPWGRGMFVIAMTGWGQEEDRERTREAGFDAHLVKPVDSKVLVELLTARARSR